MALLRSLIVVGGVLLASACSAPASSAPPVRVGNQFTMRVDSSMQFATPNLEVPAGQPVQLTLENTGDMPHDFTLTEGVAQPIKVEAKTHESTSGTFTIDKPGTYQFVCSQPAHALAGMRGTIVAR
jgi:plastocyanin